jgi:hypothetical protein
MGKCVHVLVLVLFFGAAPAWAGQVPDNQPLPGYMVNNPPLAPEVIGGKPTRVLQCIDRHAAYIIEVPAKWNGRLAMWAHGYRGTGTVLTVDLPDFSLRGRILQDGYAWAASSYYANGYDVRAVVTTTHDLAQRFAELVAKPKQVLIAGVVHGWAHRRALA